MSLSISSALVGHDLGFRTVEVSARRILAYAAVIGESAYAALDDAAPDGLIALPQFCVALEWLLAGDWNLMQRSGIPRAALDKALHAGQDSTFNRPIRTSDRLRISGRIAGIRATRAGALVVTHIEISDETSHQVAVATWSTALFRGVGVDGPDRMDEQRTPVPTAPIGPAVVVEIPVARGLPHVYTECSGIWNPIHTERRAALAAGLPDIIVHGTATWAIAGQELLKRCGSESVGRFARLAGEFRAPVIPGTTIRLEYWEPVTGTGVVPFTVRNAAGEIAIANGSALFRAAAH
jgi:acyl dehydratase